MFAAALPATSHHLGQGFARTYDVRYAARDGSEQ
jgi:hypothetical protein